MNCYIWKFKTSKDFIMNELLRDIAQPAHLPLAESVITMLKEY